MILATLELLLLYPYAVYSTIITPATPPDRTFVLFGGLVSFLGDLPHIREWICAPTVSLLTETVRIWAELWYVNLLLLVMFLATSRKKKDRPFNGIEHGSSRWAGKEDYKEFSPRPGAFPLAHNLWIGADSNLPNLHSVVIGSTGQGKSFQSLTPALLALVGSYIVADVKGSLYTTTRHLMESNGYDVKVLNLKDTRFSDGFNPFPYCRVDSDINELATSFVLNSRTEGNSAGEQFWDDSTRALFCSIGHYMLSEPEEDASMPRMLEIVSDMEVVDGRIAPWCFYQRQMTARERENPYDPAVVNYKLFTSGAGETLQSILISIGTKLQLWIDDDIQMMSRQDDFHLRELAQSKKPTVIYLILPEKGETMKPISAMFIQTVFRVYSDVALNVTHGKLPIRWMFLLDEFANLGKFPDIVSMLTLVRAYGMNLSLYLQSTQQLKNLYRDQDQTIIGNCAAFVYLGCNEPAVHKEISERLDKTTIFNDSSSHAITGHGSDSESVQNIGRSLMTPGEVATKLKGRSIVFLPDRPPFIGDKVHTQEMAGYDLLGREVDGKHQYAAYKNNRSIEEDYRDIYEQRRTAFNAMRTEQIEEHQQQIAELIAAEKAAADAAAAGDQPRLVRGFDEFEQELGIFDEEESVDTFPEEDAPVLSDFLEEDLVTEELAEDPPAHEAEIETSAQGGKSRGFLEELKQMNRR